MILIKRIETFSKEYVLLVEKCGSVFNQPAWLSLYDSLHVNGIYNLNNELIGAFNVYSAKKFGVTYYLVPPYSPSNALFFVNPAESNANRISFEKAIHEAISNYFLALKGSLIISAFPPEIIDTQAYFWSKFKVIPNYTYRLVLNKTEEQLFDNLTSEKRKSIRKAQKDNVTVKLCEDYKLVKQLVLKTFDRKNKTVSVEFLDKILFNYANNANSFAFVAYINNTPTACTFCVHNGKTSYYLFGGYDESNKHHGAGPSCMWQAILYARNLGVKIFDFEGSMLQEVEKYFREFGGDLVPYYTIQKAWLPLEILLKLKIRNRF
jgi:hypothetical protein